MIMEKYSTKKQNNSNDGYKNVNSEQIIKDYIIFKEKIRK